MSQSETYTVDRGAIVIVKVLEPAGDRSGHNAIVGVEPRVTDEAGRRLGELLHAVVVDDDVIEYYR